MGDEAAFGNVALCLAYGGEKRDFFGDVTVVDVVGEPVNGLQNLVLDAYGKRLWKNGLEGKVG